MKVVSEGRCSAVCLNDLQRIPQSLADGFLHLNPVSSAVVLDSVVPVQPDGLAVLVKTDFLHSEELAEDLDHVLRLSLHQVEFTAVVPELGVEILQTLQQKLELVVFTVFGGGCLPVKYKPRNDSQFSSQEGSSHLQGQQLASLVLGRFLQALIVMKSQSISKP